MNYAWRPEVGGLVNYNKKLPSPNETHHADRLRAQRSDSSHSFTAIQVSDGRCLLFHVTHASSRRRSWVQSLAEVKHGVEIFILITLLCAWHLALLQSGKDWMDIVTELDMLPEYTAHNHYITLYIMVIAYIIIFGSNLLWIVINL